MTVIKLIEVMSFIDHFIAETTNGKSPWTKQFFLSLINFLPLNKYPRQKYAIWL